MNLQLSDYSRGYDEEENYISASTQPRRMRRVDRRWITRNNGKVARRPDGRHRGTDASVVSIYHHGYEPEDPYNNGTYRRQQIEKGVTNAAFDQLNDSSEITFFWENSLDSITPNDQDSYYQNESVINGELCSSNFFPSSDDGYQFWLDHGYYEDDSDYNGYSYGCFDDDSDDYVTWEDEYAIYLLAEDYIPASNQPKRHKPRRRMRHEDRRWTVRNNGTIAPRQNKHHRGTKICGKLRHFVTGVSPWRRNQIDRDVQRAALDQLNDYSKIRFFWE